MQKSATNFKASLSQFLSCEQLRKLDSMRIGIAGAGGLGSNIAMMLARSGIGQFALADDDIVETGNLNRQSYWPRHVNMPKVYALTEILQELNPAIKIEIFRKRLDQKNLDHILDACPIWVEALDDASSKALFVEKALLANCRVVAASGICGIGGEPMRQKQMGNLVVIGDFCTDMEKAPPMAPRVIQAAALMADIVLKWALEDE